VSAGPVDQSLDRRLRPRLRDGRAASNEFGRLRSARSSALQLRWKQQLRLEPSNHHSPVCRRGSAYSSTRTLNKYVMGAYGGTFRNVAKAALHRLVVRPYTMFARGSGNDPCGRMRRCREPALPIQLVVPGMGKPQRPGSTPTHTRSAPRLTQATLVDFTWRREFCHIHLSYHLSPLLDYNPAHSSCNPQHSSIQTRGPDWPARR
jgi:hypothetical protein